MSLAKPIALIAFMFLALLWFSQPSHAEGLPCGNRAAIIKALSAKYKESPKFLAIAGQKNLVEIFISKTGTFTILLTPPAGQTCIIMAGDSWDQLPSVTIIPGDDS